VRSRYGEVLSRTPPTSLVRSFVRWASRQARTNALARHAIAALIVVPATSWALPSQDATRLICRTFPLACRRRCWSGGPTLPRPLGSRLDDHQRIALPLQADAFTSSAVLWADGERVIYRGWRDGTDGDRKPALAVVPATKHLAARAIDCLAHEYSLRAELDGAWAAGPIELIGKPERIMLLLEDPGGEPLEQFLGAPTELGRFLRLAVSIATALSKLHRRGLVHKNIKPANILVNCTDRKVRLTGFGLASRLPRERPSPEPPEIIAGTLAYMAPEQTGRMNRSVDFAQRPLFARHHVLSNADRCSAVYGN
jgi:hypothetical protein